MDLADEKQTMDVSTVNRPSSFESFGRPVFSFSTNYGTVGRVNSHQILTRKMLAI